MSVLLLFGIETCVLGAETETEYADTGITGEESLPEGDWQAEISFPDWQGRVDDTLAMNSMYSFFGYAGQGTLYDYLQSTTSIGEMHRMVVGECRSNFTGF